MVKMVPVSRETHAGSVWRRLQTFRFVAKEHYVPIAGLEFGRVSSAMPIAIVELSGQLVPVAVLSLEAGVNAFVAPDGRWLAPYIPLLVQTYPFRLLRQDGTDQYSLWVDADAEHLGDSASSTELYYDQEGNLAPGLKAIFDLLAVFEQNRIATAIAVTALAKEGVLCPWEIKVNAGDRETLVRGLQRVNETALGNLDDAAFLRLRKSNAIAIAYAQLLSMGHLALFSQLKQLRSRFGNPTAAPKIENPSAPSAGSFTMIEPDSLRFD